MRLLIIDNYDSFTYNLFHYAEPFVEEVQVYRNDEISLEQVDLFDAIILSPGPGTPADTGISMDVVKQFAGRKKIFGVCMGMQVIAEAFGASLRNLNHPLHGVAVETYVLDNDEKLFQNLPKTFMSGRYHSWVVDEVGLPSDFIITAKDEFGLIQAIRHKDFDISGVQFHPESILTENGKKMLENWLKE